MDITTLLKRGFKLTAIASFFFWHFAFALPEGGQVAAGSAQISQPNSQTVIINQASQNAVINWSSFNTTQPESVKFNQSSNSSIALNRINSGLPTSFAGSLSANGQVWILNPAGVVFTPTSQVNVAGLLVTTHNITDSNFMSGHYQFDAVPGYENSKIINNGLITAKDSGLVALVAPGVENNGTITANLGKVYLASGSSFVLDLYGDQLINFGTSAPVQNGYVSNSGTITASGGRVSLTANSAAQVVNNVVSMSGVIEATTATTGQNGEIILNGGSTGVTRVSGKLKASHVETSGHTLIIDPTTVIDASNWLIDPADLTITGADSNVTGSSPFKPTGTASTLNVATLTAALGTGNVTVMTSNDGFFGNGDIFVNAAVSWSAATSLTVSAYRNITINNPISSTSGSSSLVLKANNAAAFLVGSTNGVVTNNSTLTIAGSVTVFYNPPVAYTSPVVYSNTGGPVTAYMLVNNVTELQNLNTNLTGTYALNTNIDATSTINLNAGAGFVPIGAGSVATAFSGFFNGQNYIINGLYINRPATNFVGLFGSNIGNGATISNVGLTNVNITGQEEVGGLVGHNGNGVGALAFSGAVGGDGNSTSNIANVYVTGSVNSIQTTSNNVNAVGGLIGFNASRLAAISNSYSTATVTASSTATNVSGSSVTVHLAGGFVGGLIGDTYGPVTQSYASGNVYMTTPGLFIGGLFGGAAVESSPINQSYSSGTIYAASGSKYIGGFTGDLVGTNIIAGATNLIANSYSTSNIITNNSSLIGGFIGEGDAVNGATPTISNSYSSGAIIGAGNITSVGGFGGLYTSLTTTNNFWDAQSSGISTDAHTGLGVTGKTTAQMEAATTFTGATWSMTNIPSITATAPAFTWFVFEGQTRLLLMWENKPTAIDPIVNAHEVQMMGAALGANYVMGANVDFNPAMNNISDVWATNRARLQGNGFVPVGNSVNNFTGTLNGLGYIIDNLYINSSASQNVGLFGVVNNATIQKLSVTNASITQTGGANASGIIIGIMNGSSALSLSYASGAITNQGDTGGLVGDMFNASSITDSYNIASVTSKVSGFAGGIVGSMVSGTPSVTRTYDSGAVTGTGFVGGIVGNFAAGTLTNNYWDINTSTVGITHGCGSSLNCAGTSGLTTAQSLLIGSYAGWSITATQTITATPPAFTWFIFTGQTRPMLMIENNPNIYNAHQLQMMGAALGGSYLLLHNIDMTSSFTYVPDVWVTNYNTPTGLGFLPVGGGSATTAFQGFFNGQNYTINNLYINRPTTNWVGLFGSNIGSGTTIQNVGLTNVNITGQEVVGGLIGQNGNGSLIGFVGGSGTTVGNTFSNIANVYTTGAITSNVTTGTHNLVAGLIGYNTSGSVSNAYSTVNVTASNTNPGLGIAGGLIGENYGNVTRSFATGNIIALTPLSVIGGFIASNFYGTVDQSYGGGNIFAAAGSTRIGGFMGYASGSSLAGATNLITNSYSYSNIYTSNSSEIGGFIGRPTNILGASYTISNSYSSGAIIGIGNTNVGGFGGNYVAAVTTNNFWDTQSSGIATDARSGLGVTGQTTAQMQTLATFTGATWSMTGTPSATSTAPANIWFIFPGSTRPLLMMENTKTVVNAHELQMMGAALGGTYSLGNNIDLTNSFRNISDVWATNVNTPVGAGFVPIGAGSAATAFQGIFNGNNFIINNLYINRPTTNFVGLFGTNIGNGTTISNVGLTNVNVTGQSVVGGLLGQNSNSGATGFTGGTPVNQVGNTNSIITNVYVTGTVTSTTNTTSGYAGGLIGHNSGGSVSNAYSTANVYAGNSAGGLIGANFGNVTQSYASGNVTSGSFAGGFTASNFYGTISQSYSSGNVYAPNGSINIGGFAGQEDATGSGGATNTIINSYSTGNVYTNNSTAVGGFVGILSNVNGGTPVITNSYSSGSITGAGNTNVGGFIGRYVAGTTTNNFWDTQSSGISTDPRSGLGDTGKTTAQMEAAATFTGATWSLTNAPSTTFVAPAFTWFVFEGKTRPLLMWENKPTATDPVVNAHEVQMMGAALDGTYSLGNNVDFNPAMNNISDVWATNRARLQGNGFVPVGNTTNNFTGTLNGLGYIIDNLYINTAASVNVGLFGVTNNATIQKLSVTNAAITQTGGANGGGIIIGTMNGSSALSLSYASGAINNTGNTGGLVGDMSGTSSITDSYNITSVTSTVSGAAGGIVGTMSAGTPSVVRTYDSGAVVGTGLIGGIIGNYVVGTRTNNYWDTQTSGTTFGCNSGACAGTTGLTTAQSLLIGSYGGWSITATPTLTSTAPAFTWYIFTGQTRPMLMIENNSNIYNAHQLQMMGAALGGSYLLLHNIDMTSSFTYVPDVWVTNYNTPTGLGFLPVGGGSAATAFQGFFNGQNYTINNLYINRPTTSWVGLFGSNIGSGTTIQNVGLTNVNITGSVTVGALVGQNSNGTSANSFVGGTGNFLGNIASNISNVYSTGTVNGSSVVGGLIGINTFGTISNAYTTANVSAQSVAGGFVGDNFGTITQSFASGNVTQTSSGAAIGGFAGGHVFGTISQSYSSGTVYAFAGSSAVGGFVGELDASTLGGTTNTISNSYSVSNVFAPAGTDVAGFVGDVQHFSNNGGTPIVQNSYSSGNVSAVGGTNVGGFIGSIAVALTATNNFWDTQSSGQATSVGGAGVTGKTTAQMQTLATFSGATWSITSTPTTTATPPANIWFIFPGSTRPLLMMENTKTVVNGHELQMMGAALGGSYTLGNNIDLTNSFRNVSDVWATNINTPTGAGFVPIGAGSAATAFQGVFNGNNYIINNLYINRPATNFVGLFGANIGNGMTISNVGLTNVNVTGQENVGGLLGQNSNGNFTGLFTGGTCLSCLGNTNSNIANVYSTGSVTSTAGLVGGLIGLNTFGSISNVYSTANITAGNGTVLIWAGAPLPGVIVAGGLIGGNYGNVTQSYAMGNITFATGSQVGGFAGFNSFGSISQSYSNGNIYAANGSMDIGGFVGIEDSTSTGGATNTITNSYSVSNIYTNNSSAVGGFAGMLSNFSGGTPTISNSYSSGSITGAGNTNVGGFLGQYVAGTTTNNFWDTQSSGISTDPRSGLGDTGKTTAQMEAAATFTGATWSLTNAPSTTFVAPAFTWFVFEGKTRPLLMWENKPTAIDPIVNAHEVQMMGAALGASYVLGSNVDFNPAMNNISDVWATNRARFQGNGYVPVGNSVNNFTGTLNGLGYIIDNLYINTAVSQNVGLFGITNNAIIQKLSVTNAAITQTGGANASGIIAGVMNGSSSINLSYASGAITNTGNTGGLAGDMSGTSSITDSYNIASVTSTVSGAAGGIVGTMSAGTPSVVRTYDSGAVTGTGLIGGIIGNYVVGTRTNNYWDTQTSGTTFGCNSGACAGTQGLTTAQSLLIGSYSGWSITSTPTITSTAPAFTWFIFTGQTRPMLMIENNPNIYNAHQLQMMGAALGGSYNLLHNIDLTSSFTYVPDVWATNQNTPMGTGFYPIGYATYFNTSAFFQGNFYGNNYTINDLYIHLSNTVNGSSADTDVGLFGNIGQGATVQNIGLTNINIVYTSTTTITSTGNTIAGGLAGLNNGTITNSYTTGSVTLDSGAPLGDVGGFVGVNNGTITNSYNLANVFNTPLTGGNSARASAGGLVGANWTNGNRPGYFPGIITNSYNAGNVTISFVTGTGLVFAGGVAAGNYGGFNLSVTASNITNTYNIGTITALGNPTLSNAFAIGGVVGVNANSLSLFSNNYNSGVVSATSGYYTGGLVGSNGSNISASFWDIAASGQTAAYGIATTFSGGAGTITNIYGGCFGNTTCGTAVNASSATPKDLSLLATYNTGGPTWSITSTATITSTPPVATWFIFPGSTRPLLMMENTKTVVNAHELQMMGATLGGSYTLGNNIDLGPALTNISDVWATNYNTPTGAGFVPIGAGSAATAFQGIFNGNNFIINNLYINRPTTNWIGLFGVNIGNGMTISNVGLTNVNISGKQAVGGLVGQNGNGSSILGFTGGTGISFGNTLSNISNVYVTGTLTSSTTGVNLIGGLIGYNTAHNSTISNAYANVAVTASSTATNVSGQTPGNQASGAAVGGLIGDNYGIVTQSYASGTVNMTTPGSYIGGLIGYDDSGSVDQSYSNVTITAANGSKDIGGFMGFFLVSPTFTGAITNSYSVSNIIANNATGVGGFIGELTNAGGVVPSISNSYSSGNISGNGNTSIGGFGGIYVSSTTTNDFWDTQSSGISTDSHTGLGVTGKTTAQMEAAATFTGATWSLTNAPSTTFVAPAFTWFVFEGKTRPLLMWENKPTATDPIVNAHEVQMMGAALDGTYFLGSNVDFNPGMNNILDVWATNRARLQGNGYVPVGNSVNNFTGTLNGLGYIIDNLYINTAVSQSVGLFGITNNAIIQKLSVTNAAITQSGGANASGIIVGVMNGSSSINLSYASGAITNTGNTGGLVGDMSGTSSITDSYNIASVTSTVSGAAGGIVGTMSAGTPSVVRTYDSGAVTGTGLIGGIIGNYVVGTRTNNFWDTQTSGTTFGCNSGACAGTTGLTTAQSLLIGSYGGWSITATPTLTGTAPAFTWYIFTGQTRPLLMIENNSNIYNAHQLQMMGAALGGSYLLLHNIDMTSSLTYVPDVWVTNYNTPTGLGFLPVGAASVSTAFQGNFNGNNYSINNLYINRPSTKFIGLFGAVIGNGTTIKNVGLTNVNITGQEGVGALVGQVGDGFGIGFSGGAASSGGFSTQFITITNTYSTGVVNGGWDVPTVGTLVGGLIGFTTSINSTLSNSYSTANVNAISAVGASLVGGLVGDNNGNITTSYASGAITTKVAGTYVGGLVGYSTAATLSQSYSSGNIYAAPGSSNVGGFIGLMYDASSGSTASTSPVGTITNSYSVSNIFTSNSTNVGGFAGQTVLHAFANPVINTSYSSGSVTGFGNTNVGGFIGNRATTTVNNSFWDTQSSGLANATGTGVATGITGQTTAQMQTLATFTGATWSMTGTPSATSTAPNTIWFIFPGNTRPLLMMENTKTIVNGHELQMMGATLGGSYQLGGNIDFINGLTSVSDVWATNYNTPVGAGFVPVGAATIATAFQGNFNGNNYIINNLYINRPASNFVALFGTHIGSGTLISNVGLTNVNIRGAFVVGGLIGQNGNGNAVAPLGPGPDLVVGTSTTNVSNAYVTGTVNSSTNTGNVIGGLIGINTSGLLSNSYSTATVNAQSTLTNPAGTTVAAFNSAGAIGGLIGTNYTNVTQSYASGNVNVTTPGAFIGGLFGFTYFGTVSQSYSSGTVTVANGSKWVGGFSGYIDGHPSGTNTITNSYSVSNIVTNNSTVMGGFAGLMTAQGGSPVLSNSYSSGAVIGTGNTTVGGFLGQQAAGTATNDFWDTQSSGAATSAGGAGVVGKTTAQMETLATFSGAAWSITGTPSTTFVSPQNTWFIFPGLTRPILMMENTPTVVNAHEVQMMGAALGGNYQITTNIDMKPGLTNVSDVWATNYLTPVGQGFVPVGYDANVTATGFTPQGTEFTGTLNGNGYNINNLYINNTPGYSTFGLFGATSGNVLIQNIGLTNVNIFGSNAIGGLVGNMIGTGTTLISNAFSTGSVTSNVSPGVIYYAIGGLIGHAGPLNGGQFTIQNSYSTVTVSATVSQTVGGFIGLAQAAYTNFPGNTVFSTGIVNIINSYSSGSVTAPSGTIAGFSNFRTGAIVTNDFWDVVTSGRTNGYVTLIGAPTINGLYAGCFAGGGTCATQTITNATNAGVVTPKDLSVLGTYTTGGSTWSITATSSTTATVPNFNWFVFPGQTRPLLMMENKSYISSPHQLQMMGAALGGNYYLQNTIDFSTVTSRADVWNTNFSTLLGNGFVPVGTAALPFSGVFNGEYNTVNALYINSPVNTNTGLFGKTYVTSFILDAGVTNANVVVNNTTSDGSVAAGILAGLNSGRISNSYVTGNITAGNNNYFTGGLVGNNITFAGNIVNSFSTANVTSGTGTNNTGGFVGGNSGMIATSYSTGIVLVGTGSSSIGGFAGTASGDIRNIYSFSPISANSSTRLGGLFGSFSSGTLQYSYAAGPIVGTGNTSVGGIVGLLNGGAVNNSVWDLGKTGVSAGYGTTTSGSISNVYGGCFGNTLCGTPSNATNATTYDLTLLANYTGTFGWISGTVISAASATPWNTVNAVSYPYLRTFYTTVPRFVTATSNAGPITTTNLYQNAVLIDTATTGANGESYFLEGFNNISRVNHTVADNDLIFMDYPGASPASNAIAFAPAAGGQMGANNGLVLNTNTVTVGLTGTVNTQVYNNTVVGTAKGALVGSAILYSLSGNNLIMNLGDGFATTALTTYTINGDITTTNGNIIFNGPVIVSAVSPTITATTSGNINFNKTINGTVAGTQSLTVIASATGAVRFKGNIGVGTSLNNFSVTGNIINFDGAITQVTSTGPQTYTGVGVNPLMTIGADPIFNGLSFSIPIAVLINANTTYNSSAGNIDFQNVITGDGISSLTLKPIGGSAIFRKSVGTAPLGSLVVNGTTLFSQGSTQVVNTVGSQTYINTVTLGNDITMTSSGNSGIAGTQQILFGLGAAGIFSDVPNTRSLTVVTKNSANGASGDGIHGTVNVGTFTMGGTGGGDISPVSVDSVVGNQGGQQAWNNTAIQPSATGKYCVNGFCISGTRVLTITATNGNKTYGVLFTPTLFSTAGLATGDSVTGLTLTSPLGNPSTAAVSSGPYPINASNAVGPGVANHYASINYVSGLLTVLPAAITITPTSQTKNFGTTLPTSTTFFTSTPLPNGETIGTITIASGGLPGTAPAGSYLIANPTGATGGTFNPANYTISYNNNAGASILVIESLVSAVPNNIPPTQEFIPPEGPACAAAGCDNERIIIIDPLNGFGLPTDLIVYPYVPGENYSSDNSNMLGVVTDTVGAPSEAVNAEGITRELSVGDVIYKDDIVIVGGESCLGIKIATGEKKWLSDTKHDPAWSHECKINKIHNVAAGYQPAKKPIALTKHNSLMQVLTSLELPSMKAHSKKLYAQPEQTPPKKSLSDALSSLKDRVAGLLYKPTGLQQDDGARVTGPPTGKNSYYI